MAQTGFTPIQFYVSTTASNVPSAGNLVNGEPAVNIADMALYFKDSGGVVRRLMNNPVGLKYPTADGTSGQVISTDGAGVLSFVSAATGDVTLNGVQTLTNKTIVGLKETQVAVAASNIDLSAGNYFSKTISGTTTFTVSNTPATGTSASFILDLTNGGSASITWWSGVKWPSGTAPTLTASGRDVLGFFTYDGGTTWTGLVLGKDVK